METPSNTDLPADIIREILLRLPLKSLLKFKCVCKRWYTLIGSRSFADQHFGHESNRERLLVRYYGLMKNQCVFALYVDEICSEYEEPDHLQMPDTVEELIGPVNGVFCVVSKSKHVALWNPALGEFKPLPSLHLNVQPHLSVSYGVFGFGLDPLSGDYKDVSILYLWDINLIDSIYPPLVSIHSSGIDSWRHFEDLDLVNSSHCAYCSHNTYLNGVYYWLMEYDNYNVAAILAFDTTTEKFQEIQVPECVKLKLGDLALYDDSITLLAYDSDNVDKYIDVLVMNKEGCWTKISTVGPFQDYRWSFGFWKNNELLIERAASLLTLCNVFTQKLRTVEVRSKDNGFRADQVFSYKESLVSISGVRDNCKLWDCSADFV